MWATILSSISILTILLCSLELTTYSQSHDDVSTLVQKGVFLFNQNRYNDAIAAFDRVLAVEPNNTYALNQKGLALFTVGRTDEASKVFDKALAIDPKNVHALTNKGLALGALGKYNESLIYYKL